jgi:hypothetical protein
MVMPVVRMLQYISGGRHDGRDWPDPQRGDGEIEVPDWEAQDLIAGRLAVPAGGGAGSSAAPAPQAEAPAQYEPGAGAAAESRQLPGHPPEPEPGPVPEPEPEPEPAAVAPPEVSAVTEVSPVAEVPGQPAAAAGVPDAAGLPEPVAETVMEELPDGPPNPHDIKQRWIDYAVTRGEDPVTARDMTKADLMSKYGGRL